MEDDELMVEVVGFVRDEGSLVLLKGVLEDEEIIFACERRYAADILDALERDEAPLATVPDYMIWGG